MEQNCPCCGNHCPQSNLMCPRGQRYFGSEAAKSEERRDRHGRAEEQDEIILLLRKCGHYLHHGGVGELKTLTAEERKTLTDLLKKCYAEWSER